MTKNMGTTDRLLRTLLGIVLLGAAMFGGLATGLAVIAALVGAVMLLTASLRLCPLYSLLGLKTCSDC
ncbi:hypothetical protein PSA7680_02143 [Pseudoruegeria aquimaris]|uniref:Inner membrane protein YgaP-like transmembrane domain-containing protein n=1 Tax=Pseudoruegeria aquimaris TaxID=393663 RepID=A0A1Y5SL97_9RHOB|nr:DUF2892 domain-containing protein [Pseudoruegeria aquimaris]SLN43025.1 hypothetical protein PSA7680_02143 [Pseudoruegeria aquimaris]